MPYWLLYETDHDKKIPDLITLKPNTIHVDLTEKKWVGNKFKLANWRTSTFFTEIIEKGREHVFPSGDLPPNISWDCHWNLLYLNAVLPTFDNKKIIFLKNLVFFPNLLCVLCVKISWFFYHSRFYGKSVWQILEVQNQPF